MLSKPYALHFASSSSWFRLPKALDKSNIITPAFDPLLDPCQRGPIKSELLVIIGWLVGNAVLSETPLRIFLIFCIKLGDYKGRKEESVLLG